MTKRALVCLAPGFEEIEAVTVVDVLRRAEVDVVVGGLDGAGAVTASRGVRVVPDVGLDEALLHGPYDAVVLPGGRGGTDALLRDVRVHEAVRAQLAAGRLVAAICAAPEVLHALGALEGKRYTSHPGVRERVASPRYSEDRVVRDGTLITSRAAGTAMEFAFALVAALCGPEAIERVNAGVLARL